MSTGLLLDGVFASEAIDSSGEILDIAGLDISDFEEGKGVANYEHQGHDKEEHQGQEIVGKVIFAKKIYRESDVGNDRERMFWNRVKLPFLYGVVRLYDGAGHDGAKALAAIVRDSHANEEPTVVGFSIEGSTLDHDKSTNRLKSTIARRVAITLRPCNKQAVSALLADPNAPEGYEKNPVAPDLLAMVPAGKQTRKAEGVDPLYRRLGGSEAVYGSAVTKALSAGSYGGAPGGLTGGAALQREDRGRVNRALALAAYRDWNRVTPFREFLKARMPEASDEFLNHFADLVEQQYFRVRKAALVVADLIKKGKEVKAPAPQPTAATEPPLLIQGRPVPRDVTAKSKGSSFDPAAGRLTVGQRVFQTSTPSQPHPHLVSHVSGRAWVGGKDVAKEFAAEMQAQRRPHQLAMQHWLPMNERYRRGDVNPGVVAHAVAFCMMSPGNPVPVQEHMYANLVDAMRARGAGVPTAENWNAVGREWMARNKSRQLPEHSRDHFRALEQELRTDSGHFQGYAKPDQFREYFGDYLKDHHADLVNLMREAPGNSQHLARRLYEVRGVGHKIARYVAGMLGAGDVVVPDTHFMRHYFGGRPDAPGQKTGSSPDTASLAAIEAALYRHANAADNLAGIDDHYFRNHDAVKAVLADPALGPYFKGHERDAIFPAFWWHWMSVPGHEARLGIPNARSSNEDTSHAPYWQAVEPLLRKAEQAYDPHLPVRTAMQHLRWVEAYGPVRALALYFQHLAPRLVANDARMPREHLIRKFDGLQVELGAALAKAAEPAELESGVPAMEFQGRQVKPGRARLGGRTVAVLAADPTHVTVVPHDRLGHHGPEDLLRVPRHQLNLEIHSFPETQDVPHRVDAARHGVEPYLRHPETQALAHGFDFAHPREPAVDADGEPGGHRWQTSGWGKDAQGRPVYVKADPGLHHSLIDRFSEPRAEGLYHNLARDFFGLGQYVPPVAVVRHPRTGREHAIVAGVSGHELEGPPENDPVLRGLRASGDLDRLALMDMVMGNTDRHTGNFLVDPEQGLRLIDHNVLFKNEVPDSPWTYSDAFPMYWTNRLGAEYGPTRQPLHPEAVRWAKQLDPSQLQEQLELHEVPAPLIRGAVSRLRALQDHVTLRPEGPAHEAWSLPYRVSAHRMAP